MKQASALFQTLTVLLLGFFLTASARAEGPGYHVMARKVVGGDGGWDYLAVDSIHHRLFVSHSTHVVVLSLPGLDPAGDIPGTSGVHGIAFAPDLNRGFTSNGRSDSVTIFDLGSLRVIGEVTTTGKNPDAIVYDPFTKRVFTFNGRSGSATVIDAVAGKVVSTISLPGKPEFATVDGKGRLYVNIEDKSEVVPIDTQAMTAGAPWPLSPCESPSGMAIDVAHGRIFCGCENQMMAVVALESGKVVATVPIGKGVDANRFDPGTQFVFSSNGEGTLTIAHEDSPDKYSVVETVPTQRGARTMALDPGTHAVYLSTAELGPRPAATADNPRPRPTILPGTFTVLAVAR